MLKLMQDNPGKTCFILYILIMSIFSAVISFNPYLIEVITK